MSYSFSETAPTKAALKGKVTKAMAAVMSAQPMHCTEGPQAVAAAHAMIDAAREGAPQYTISMNGSVSGNDRSDPAAQLTQVSVGIAVSAS